MNGSSGYGGDEVDAIVDRLTSVSEDLNDLAMNLVRDALEHGAGERPEMEKRLSRARRTVDRAIDQLRGSATSD